MTTAHPSGPRPLGRGKRKGAQRAYRQGDLDGLCGVYSVVNALQAVAPELDAKLSARLFGHLVRRLRGRTREPLAVITGGIEHLVLIQLLKIAIKFVRDKLGITIKARGLPMPAFGRSWRWTDRGRHASLRITDDPACVKTCTDQKSLESLSQRAPGKRMRCSFRHAKIGGTIA